MSQEQCSKTENMKYRECIYISHLSNSELSDMKNSDRLLHLGLFQAWPMSQSKTCILALENLKIQFKIMHFSTFLYL